VASSLRPIIGRFDNGAPLDGIERMFDDVLRGDSGKVAVARDNKGISLESAVGPISMREGGNTVVLTIIRSLQEICDRALATAIDTLGATGGDVVVLNPHNGEVLAMVSRRADPRAIVNTAITEPFEPGSTMKPLVAAALLDRKLARVNEVINTHNGLLVRDGRRIKDHEPHTRMTLAEVIQHSSNIGIVGFADRLKPSQKYEVLRDFGFGLKTGLPLPGEARGTLRPPQRWSKQSSASLSMGYEVAVTALQLAAAYGVIANGGELVEPQIVKEIRDPDGKVLFTSEKRVIRRVIRDSVAKMMQKMLVGVVKEGTATKANLAVYDLGGKTGTARRTAGRGGYKAGSYTASFAGLFPGEKPQIVVLVKIDNPDPRRTIYGGEAAAPVSRAVVEAAIAAESKALDPKGLMMAAHQESLRRILDSSRIKRAAEKGVKPVQVVLRPETPPGVRPLLAAEAEPEVGAGTFVVSLPTSTNSAPVLAAPRAVPDVGGMTIRQAVHALHEAGFRVRLAVLPEGQTTMPAAGSVARPGSVVRLGKRR
jgi:cell division protein FtsI (penicillin-binding protein 3)